MRVFRKKRFLKKYLKLTSKNQEKVEETLLLFAQNPFAAKLNNHALIGGRLGLRSLNVSGDIRILFRELSNGA